MQGWTSIDADGDGHTWGMISDFFVGASGHDDSNDGVASQSYASGTALSPDNYLVSPQMTLGGTMTMWVAPYSDYFGAEHFGIYVSTTGMNPSDFTMVNEWTIGSKEAKQGGSRDDNPKVGTWNQYTVDLSAYDGQTGYIAIRHFNCTDQWALLVDDINIQPNQRSFQSFNVYRKNELTGSAVSQLNSGVTEYEFMDNTWGNAATGVYRWGISANYAGNRGESEITWSNTIDKDMTAEDTVNVTTNSNDPVNGAVVTLANVNEPENVYNVTLDETGTHTWADLRKGEYNLSSIQYRKRKKIEDADIQADLCHQEEETLKPHSSICFRSLIDSYRPAHIFQPAAMENQPLDCCQHQFSDLTHFHTAVIPAVQNVDTGVS